MDPATGMIIAATIASAAQAGGSAYQGAQSKKAGKAKAKEMKRETYATMLNDALQRSAEIEGQRLQSGMKLGKRRSQSLVDSASLLREAFGI